MVWAWLLWLSHSSKHVRKYGLGMDALGIALIKFGHGCSGYRIHRNMNGIIVWAWMFWLSHSLKHEWHYGLGMDVLVLAFIKI